MIAALYALLAGPALAVTPSAEGDVVITEILPAPASGMPEWIEVYNNAGTQVELDNCNLVSSTSSGWEDNNTSTYPMDFDLAPNGYALLSQYKSLLAEDPTLPKGALGCVAYDSEGDGRSCIGEVDVLYSGGFNLSNSGDEVVCLICNPDAPPTSESCDSLAKGDVVIDRIALDWDDFEGLCDSSGEDYCSISLHQDNLDGIDNDDPENWCVSDAVYYDLDFDDSSKVSVPLGNASRGTPGQGNSCVDPEPPCAAGDVFITEVMVKSDEWIELYNDGADVCGLFDCELSYLKEDDTEPTTHVIGGVVDLAAGAHALLAKSEELVSVEPEIAADYVYGSLSFTDGTVGVLTLSCDGAVVDEVTIDWELFEDDCLVPGEDDAICSVGLKPGAYDGASNDDLANWCLGPAETVYLNPEDKPFKGTPGELGACQSCECPGAGDAIFTEAMPAPEGTTEWLELTNLTDSAFDLTWCTLQRYDAETGDLETDYALALDGGGELAASASQLLSYKTCIDDVTGTLDSADTGGEAEVSPADCERGEIFYSSVTLPNTSAAVIALECLASDGSGDKIEVDRFEVDFDGSGAREGHSLLFDPGAWGDPSADNDSAENWCEASFSQQFLEVGEDECNYGSPGEVGECLSLIDDWPDGGPACRCSAATGPGAWWPTLALVALMGWRRERGWEKGRSPLSALANPSPEATKGTERGWEKGRSPLSALANPSPEATKGTE